MMAQPDATGLTRLRVTVATTPHVKSTNAAHFPNHYTFAGIVAVDEAGVDDIPPGTYRVVLERIR